MSLKKSKESIKDNLKLFLSGNKKKRQKVKRILAKMNRNEVIYILSELEVDMDGETRNKVLDLLIYFLESDKRVKKTKRGSNNLISKESPTLEEYLRKYKTKKIDGLGTANSNNLKISPKLEVINSEGEIYDKNSSGKLQNSERTEDSEYKKALNYINSLRDLNSSTSLISHYLSKKDLQEENNENNFQKDNFIREDTFINTVSETDLTSKANFQEIPGIFNLRQENQKNEYEKLSEIFLTTREIEEYKKSECEKLSEIFLTSREIEEYKKNECEKLSEIFLTTREIEEYKKSECEKLSEIFLTSREIEEYKKNECEKLSEIFLPSQGKEENIKNECENLSEILKLSQERINYPNEDSTEIPGILKISQEYPKNEDSTEIPGVSKIESAVKSKFNDSLLEKSVKTIINENLSDFFANSSVFPGQFTFPEDFVKKTLQKLQTKEESKAGFETPFELMLNFSINSANEHRKKSIQLLSLIAQSDHRSLSLLISKEKKSVAEKAFVPKLLGFLHAALDFQELQPFIESLTGSKLKENIILICKGILQGSRICREKLLKFKDFYVDNLKRHILVRSLSKHVCNALDILGEVYIDDATAATIIHFSKSLKGSSTLKFLIKNRREYSRAILEILNKKSVDFNFLEIAYEAILSSHKVEEECQARMLSFMILQYPCLNKRKNILIESLIAKIDSAIVLRYFDRKFTLFSWALSRMDLSGLDGEIKKRIFRCAVNSIEEGKCINIGQVITNLGLEYVSLIVEVCMRNVRSSCGSNYYMALEQLTAFVKEKIQLICIISDALFDFNESDHSRIETYQFKLKILLNLFVYTERTAETKVLKKIITFLKWKDRTVVLTSLQILKASTKYLERTNQGLFIFIAQKAIDTLEIDDKEIIKEAMDLFLDIFRITGPEKTINLVRLDFKNKRKNKNIRILIVKLIKESPESIVPVLYADFEQNDLCIKNNVLKILLSYETLENEEILLPLLENSITSRHSFLRELGLKMAVKVADMTESVELIYHILNMCFYFILDKELEELFNSLMKIIIKKAGHSSLYSFVFDGLFHPSKSVRRRYEEILRLCC